MTFKNNNFEMSWYNILFGKKREHAKGCMNANTSTNNTSVQAYYKVV